jgi:hypothetical protein
MKELIRLYIIPFLVLMIFQCGFVYGILALTIGKVNPLDWHPIIYTLFFEFVLLITYTSYRALTDNDDFKDIEDIFNNSKND